MKRKFSVAWKSSTKPRKQRKYRENSPLHAKQKLMHVHLSKELREKHGKRNILLRKGDKVKVLRGQFRKQAGKVEKIDLKKNKVIIENIQHVRKDGTKSPYPQNPTNLMIIELSIEDKKRRKAVERKGK